MYINILGIIIYETYFGEKNKYLVIITDKNEKISVLCKGKRNIQKTYVLLYGVFTLLSYRDKYTFIDINIKNNFNKLTSNLLAYSLAFYIIDVYQKLNYYFFNEIIFLLNKLERSNYIINFQIIKLVFELFILKQEGYLPNIKKCSICSSSNINVNCFSIINGGIICYNCFKQNKIKYVFINNTIYKCLLFVTTKESIDKALLFIANNENINVLSKLIEEYFLYHIDTKFNTANYYNKLLINK